MHQWILFWISHRLFFDEVPKIIFMDFGSLMSQIRNHMVSLSNSLHSENPAVLEHILVVYFGFFPETLW
jgi:ABC-type transport system involved in cytochrome bd biosynthesis fused ATPase/permease subunit